MYSSSNLIVNWRVCWGFRGWVDSDIVAVIYLSLVALLCPNFVIIPTPLQIIYLLAGRWECSCSIFEYVSLRRDLCLWLCNWERFWGAVCIGFIIVLILVTILGRSDLYVYRVSWVELCWYECVLWAKQVICD